DKRSLLRERPFLFRAAGAASYLAVDIALSAASDPSGALLASTATRSPAAMLLEAIFNSVTGVFGGTVTL
ncbi:MAG TPA: hypothetical protein VJV97_10690, partial [Gemmatimonadaceae bacterium]|nr:hypothetical protein [Gemmatimonadaceae bacterium]